MLIVELSVKFIVIGQVTGQLLIISNVNYKSVTKSLSITCHLPSHCYIYVIGFVTLHITDHVTVIHKSLAKSHCMSLTYFEIFKSLLYPSHWPSNYYKKKSHWPCC
ncbi:hypothetical protein RchiOBHm_Chr7g0226851 [Rosa chinensis]|uniref:Uncharacterized protein n=1 Tax=Rosa chinensis TaxID=74649 RepID=A0A2P6PEG5_ROSCH|nr:hypothetical protein RchiOBHm_Chr7g0226851 [Rosa chinensis]